MNGFPLCRLAAILGSVVLAVCGSSCTTYYDAYGYPRPAVDPGLAVAGAVAAGALGYALADSYRHHHGYYSYNGGYYYGAPYRGHCRY